LSPLTLWSALAGGMLIGTGSVLLLLLNGRIAGISGIAAGLLWPQRSDTLWRVAFLSGLIVGAALYYRTLDHAPVARTAFPTWLLALGGVLVGFGTSLGSGCTSGHGVCGLGRLSPRSAVATVAFLVTGIASAYVVRHWFGIH
jgi:uncharacterized protein